MSSPESRVPSPGGIDHLNGVLQNSHHAESQQVHLDDAHVGAVVFVPLHDHAARHRCRLEGHHRIERALANHHASGMLAEMSRQVLYPLPEVRKDPHARPVGRHAHRSQVALEGVVRIDELEVVHRLGKPVDLAGIEGERHPDITRSAAASIRDDIGGHGRAQPTVFLVDVLDDTLTAVAARQVEVDIRPLAAFL